MNAIRFKSVLNPDKFGFEFEPNSTAHWDICYRTGNLLSYHSFFYETYGDHQTQHTPLMPVSTTEGHLDWMLSLAHYLTQHPEAYGYELRSLFGYSMPSRETSEFLASIKAPKDTDPQIYYSVNECKVSKHESKRHDKRWFKLDSQPFTLYYDLDRLVWLWLAGQESRSLTCIERFGLYFAIAGSLNRSVSYHQSDSLQKATNEEVLQSARILREIIMALDAQASAKRSIEIVIGNIVRANTPITDCGSERQSLEQTPTPNNEVAA